MRIRLTVFLVSALAFALGLLWRNESLVVTGAIIHFLAGISELIQEYHKAKQYRAKTWTPKEHNWIERIGDWARGVITFAGLILMVASQSNDEAMSYLIAGGIVWGGAILCYFLSGIIAREVGGIPLSMGYGGWKIRRTRKGRLLH